MISTTRISDALLSCFNVRHTLIELYIDATLWGAANRMYRSIKDVMTLYALEKALYNAVLYNFDETDTEILIFKIREFIGILGYSSSIDYFALKYPGIDCGDVVGPYVTPITPVTPSTVVTTTSDDAWFTQNLSPLVTVNGQTTIEGINFDIDNSDIDPDTIMLEVQGDDPRYTSNDALEGWHMVGNTIHWHHFYDLKDYMQINIRWRVG